MKKMKWLIAAVWSLLAGGPMSAQTHFIAQNGFMHFKSDAPLELIEATSRQLNGVFNPAEGTFAFAVDIRSFQGFNSPLQREHFNENYLESKRYPKATFVGRVIENIDFSVPGEYEVRAKGNLEVHGIKQERIIKGKLVISPEGVRISAAFTVLLEDHQISIPQIVYQKIAEEISVDMDILLPPAAAK